MKKHYRPSIITAYLVFAMGTTIFILFLMASYKAEKLHHLLTLGQVWEMAPQATSDDYTQVRYYVLSFDREKRTVTAEKTTISFQMGAKKETVTMTLDEFREEVMKHGQMILQVMRKDNSI